MNARNFLPEPTQCDVCKHEVYYIEHLQKFGHMRNSRNVGMWKCKNNKCRALVSCHPGTTNPVGYMAQEQLRRLRTECHRAFDMLWSCNNSPFTRQSAYYWMAGILNIPKECSNISKLTEEQIHVVIEESKRVYAEYVKEKEITRKGARHSLRNKRVRKESPRKTNVKVNASNFEQYIDGAL